MFGIIYNWQQSDITDCCWYKFALCQLFLFYLAAPCFNSLWADFVWHITSFMLKGLLSINYVEIFS